MGRIWVFWILVVSMTLLSCAGAEVQPAPVSPNVDTVQHTEPKIVHPEGNVHHQDQAQVKTTQGSPNLGTVGNQHEAKTQPNLNPDTIKQQAEKTKEQDQKVSQGTQQAQKQGQLATTKGQQKIKQEQQSPQQRPNPQEHAPNLPPSVQQQTHQPNPQQPSPQLDQQHQQHQQQQQHYQHQQQQTGTNAQQGYSVNPSQGRADPNSYSQQKPSNQDINNNQAGYKIDGSISKTNEARNYQFQRSSAVTRQVKTGQTKDYTFQLLESQEFYVDVPLEQEFYLKCSVYVDENNHYKQIENIQSQTQARFTITQNHNRLMADERFYFEAAAAFNAKAKTRYIIKFYNSGRQKLINVDLKYITEAVHVENKLSTTDTQHFSTAVDQMNTQFNQVINQFRRLWFYDYKRTKDVADLSKVYYIYEIVEIIIAAIVGILQVRLVNKLLRGSNNIV